MNWSQLYLEIGRVNDSPSFLPLVLRQLAQRVEELEVDHKELAKQVKRLERKDSWIPPTKKA